MRKIKVLVIEDNRLLREGTTSMLNELEDIRAEWAQGNVSALEKAKKLKPDVILLDVGLKSPSSIKAIAAIKEQLPTTEIVVMDLIPVHSEMVDFMKAGVAGFVRKDSTPAGFLNTIRSVVKGVKSMPPTMAGSLFSQIVEQAIREGTVDKVVAFVKLTKREKEVVNLLADGVSISQIARKHKVAVFTVKSHIRSIMDKLALHTRLQLAGAADQETSS